MRLQLKYITPVLAAGTAAAAIAAAPTAVADNHTPPPPPTVTVTAAPPGPPNAQVCNPSAAATKCVKTGDAEINASVPAPYAGTYGIYGPFWGGGAG
jgi:hypothetical protein